VRLRTNDLDWKQVDDEIIALDRRDASYLTINGSGSVLWRRLAEDASHPELVTALVDAYEIDPVQARADTDAFLAELAQKGLLEE